MLQCARQDISSISGQSGVSVTHLGGTYITLTAGGQYVAQRYVKTLSRSIQQGVTHLVNNMVRSVLYHVLLPLTLQSPSFLSTWSPATPSSVPSMKLFTVQEDSLLVYVNRSTANCIRLVLVVFHCFAWLINKYVYIIHFM